MNNGVTMLSKLGMAGVWVSIILASVVGFQNCSPVSLGTSDPPRLKAENGQTYSGKIYVLSGAEACVDGRMVKGEIIATPNGTFKLTRRDCQSLTPYIDIPPTQIIRDPSSDTRIVYNEDVFEQAEEKVGLLCEGTQEFKDVGGVAWYRPSVTIELRADGSGAIKAAFSVTPTASDNPDPAVWGQSAPVRVDCDSFQCVFTGITPHDDYGSHGIFIAIPTAPSAFGAIPSTNYGLGTSTDKTSPIILGPGKFSSNFAPYELLPALKCQKFDG